MSGNQPDSGHGPWSPPPGRRPRYIGAGPVDPNERTVPASRPHRAPWHGRPHLDRQPPPLPRSQPPPGYPMYPDRLRPGSPPPPRGAGRRRWLIVAAGSAVLAVLAVLGVAAATVPTVFGGAELDVHAAQAGVQRVLTDPIDGYGRDGISDVRCNGGRNPAAKRGTEFNCLVRVDGVDRQVSVVVIDNHGSYEVDQPR